MYNIWRLCSLVPFSVLRTIPSQFLLPHFNKCFPINTPAASFMRAVRYIIQNSLGESIDKKQKESRISNSLNTFIYFYSIKGIIACFYYTFSPVFIVSTFPCSLIFTLVSVSLCPLSFLSPTLSHFHITTARFKPQLSQLNSSVCRCSVPIFSPHNPFSRWHYLGLRWTQ